MNTHDEKKNKATEKSKGGKIHRKAVFGTILSIVMIIDYV